MKENVKFLQVKELFVFKNKIMDYQLHGAWILLYTFMKEIQLLC